MIRPRFLSSVDRIELEACMHRQREDYGVAQQANAPVLLDDGKSCVEIAQVLYLNDDTVCGWLKQYVAEGWDAVAYDGWKGEKSWMPVVQQVTLCVWLEERFYRSKVKIRAYVTAQFDLHYSYSACVKLLAILALNIANPRR